MMVVVRSTWRYLKSQGQRWSGYDEVDTAFDTAAPAPSELLRLREYRSVCVPDAKKYAQTPTNVRFVKYVKCLNRCVSHDGATSGEPGGKKTRTRRRRR